MDTNEQVLLHGESWEDRPIRSCLLLIILVCGASFLVLWGLEMVLPRHHCCGFESSAIGSVRAVCSAQAIFIERHPEKRYARNLDELSNFELIDAVLGSGRKEGYRFFVRPVIKKNGVGFEVIAEPANYDADARSFYADDSGVIRYDRDKRPSKTSLPLGKK